MENHERTNNTNNYSSRSASALRILCLHDINSSAAELQESLRVLGDKLYLEHGIDLVYINSPLLVQPSLSNSQRTWWEEQEIPEHDKNIKNKNVDGSTKNDNQDSKSTSSQNDKPTNNNSFTADKESKNETSPNGLFDDGIDDSDNEESLLFSQQGEENNALPGTIRYIGLDASLLLLRQVWSSMPFWGVLGVGQGAAMASFLSLLPGLTPMPSFGIYVNGTTLLTEETELLLPQSQFPCLHVVGPAINPLSERLYQQFGGQVHQLRTAKVFGKSTINTIGKFLVAQKKLVKNNTDNSGNVLALQNMLYMVEQEAASQVAQYIAKDPPTALQAIIQPQQVGGWDGMKRRPVGTGGAPCPSEFLLNRQERQNKKINQNGPSRVHPNNNNNNSSENGNQHEEQESSAEL